MADLPHAPAPPVLVCPAANGKYARYRAKNLEARRLMEAACQRRRWARLRVEREAEREALRAAAYEASTGLPYGG